MNSIQHTYLIVTNTHLLRYIETINARNRREARNCNVMAYDPNRLSTIDCGALIDLLEYDMSPEELEKDNTMSGWRARRKTRIEMLNGANAALLEITAGHKLLPRIQ